MVSILFNKNLNIEVYHAYCIEFDWNNLCSAGDTFKLGIHIIENGHFFEVILKSVVSYDCK